VDNDRAQEWNNAYSLWLAREHFAAGVLLVNGDTVHPVSVEKTLLRRRQQAPAARRARAESSSPSMTSSASPRRR
jgi:choline kinase